MRNRISFIMKLSLHLYKNCQVQKLLTSLFVMQKRMNLIHFSQVFIRSITLPNLSTVGYMISELKKKVDLSHPNAELRLFEVQNHKIRKIYSLTEQIKGISDPHWTLCAEEIPEEEKILGPFDRLIHVCHTNEGRREKFRQFGEPFFFVIHGGETAAAVRARIQMKLQIPGDEFTKVSKLWYFPLETATLFLIYFREKIFMKNAESIFSWSTLIGKIPCEELMSPVPVCGSGTSRSHLFSTKAK